MILGENVLEGTTKGLDKKLAALAIDVGCAGVPVLTGGGMAFRAAKNAPEAAPFLKFVYAGTKRTAQGQVKAAQVGTTGARGPTSATSVDVKPEIIAPQPVKPSDAVDRWDTFLGPGDHTDIHPRTGVPDPNRIVSADGTRSIRYGRHEMQSSPTNHHYHEETWYHDPAADTMTVANTQVRVPLEK
jgi:hypothetical protein